jgi:cyclopropane fatty-acyl-phospholipid synthase-like methyltransferase
MFEHVGPKNYRRYFQTLRRCLRPGGRFLFFRMWEFYLDSSAATLRAAKNDVWQFLLTPN